MQQEDKLLEKMNDICTALKDNTTVNAVTALYDSSELLRLLEERKSLVKVHSHSIDDKSAYELIKKASEDISAFDREYPLIYKFIKIAQS